MSFEEWFKIKEDELNIDYQIYLVEFGDIEIAEYNEKYPLSFNEFAQDEFDNFNECYQEFN